MRGWRSRHCLLVLTVAVSGCSSSSAPPPVAEGAEHIACALDGAAVFETTCAVERSERDGKRMLVVRHADGSFRRFEVLADERGLAVADGALQAVTTQGDGFAEIAVGSDRYRFPETRSATRNDDARNP